MPATVLAVSRSPEHAFTKSPADSIRLLSGLGVQGDAHAGATVKHRSRLARDPTQPNLRQVHLIQAELLDELNAAGFDLHPGAVGENVTTRGIALLELPTGARLRLGEEAEIELTGLRNPCAQLDRHRPGLMSAVLDRGPRGELIRRAGVMAIVIAGGEVRAGDAITATLPAGQSTPLKPV